MCFVLVVYCYSVFSSLLIFIFQTFLEAVNNIIKVKHCAFSWNSVAYVVLEQVRVDVLACTP